MKRKVLLLWMLTVLVFGAWYHAFGGEALINGYLHDNARKVVSLLLLLATLLVLYAFLSVLLYSLASKTGAKKGEVKMILGVIRACLPFVGLLTALSEWFSLGTLGTIFAAFGGMFLGWALQAPVSGLAGWLLTSLIRPFCVGDRILLPSHNLVGDVLSVTPLYTILNQVGGSVGSEEPANRTVLIPNAMLFSTLIINYTPKNQNRMMEESQQRQTDRGNATESAYMLDEFVLRITFGSDWDEAERILMEAAREVTADIISESGQEPYIRADITDWYGAFMRLRFMTLATERPRIMYELTRRIYKAIQASANVDVAIPYVYSYRKNTPVGSEPFPHEPPPGMRPPPGMMPPR
jgi:small-conductance mechanosensitive channel